MTKATIAAYRAHRARLVAQLRNSSASVRRELRQRINVYDRLLRALEAVPA
jgi:hypothetical protein